MDYSAILATAALVVGLPLFVYAWFVEPSRARRRHQTLALESLPPGLDGLTILHLSDLHLRRDDERRARMIQQVSDVDADLVVITGDFVETDADLDYCADTLRSLRARYGVFGVLGNHDYAGDRALLDAVLRFHRHRNDAGLLVERLKEAGVRILMNESVPLRIDGQQMWLVGVDDPYLEQHDLGRALAGVPADGFRLLLAHSPDVVDQLTVPGRRVDLILSGHTHGGQVVFPGVGALMTRTRIRVRPASGWLRLQGVWTHISRGLGGSVPLRFLCPPEATLIQLKASPRGTGSRLESEPSKVGRHT